MIALPFTRKQSAVPAPGDYRVSYSANGSQITERVTVIRPVRGGLLILAYNSRVNRFTRERLPMAAVNALTWKPLA